MKWSLPGKTFLLGEYAALVGAPAIVLTTNPCFELALSEKPELQDIHPESPAGRWWLQQGILDKGLLWHDPYQGRGGMGASSAQFLGAYLTSLCLQKKCPLQQEMLDSYLQSAWQGQGLCPSGYDVLAQSLSGCVYINRQQNFCHSYPWPFHDLAFLLLHTGKKLSTHHHLQIGSLPNNLNQLIMIVESAKLAMESIDSSRIIDAINAYHQQLLYMNMVAAHSIQLINFFKKQPDVLAVKGCGAMGADVLLLLIPASKLASFVKKLLSTGWNNLITSDDLYVKQALIANNSSKTLDISP